MPIKRFARTFILAASALLLLAPLHAPARDAKPKDARPAEFGDVVKLIESHYGVKHKGLPLVAKAGIKASQIVVNRMTRYSEYGTAKFVLFEDQDFASSAKGRTDFASKMRAALQPAWQSLVEVRLRQDAEQTYIYTREAGKLFKVLIIYIGERDASAVQVELAPLKLAALLKDPDTMGKTLTDEAAEDAQQ
ncbi:MAG TPA: hypothetical protein VM934_14450 [Pyrinomonadaceae bacterium]|nr:hypothetical protein [Pyrinomonadaceae bacterium]